MVFSTDWWLKRAFKFALKRYLGQLIRSEVDLELLNVELGKGTLELKGILLKCEYFNERLANTQWEVTQGYVGCARLVMPLTNLNSEPCSLVLEEALITLRPRQSGGKVCGDTQDSAIVEEAAESILAFDFEDGRKPEGEMGLDSITAGVTKIAGGIETILQKLRVKASGLEVKIELPGDSISEPSSLIAVRLSNLQYEGEAKVPTEVAGKNRKTPPAVQLQKLLTFDGLTVELYEDVAQAPQGLNCKAQQRHRYDLIFEGGRQVQYAWHFAVNEATQRASFRGPEPGLWYRVQWADEVEGRKQVHSQLPEITDEEVQLQARQRSHSEASSSPEDLGGSWQSDLSRSSVAESPKDDRHTIICTPDGIGCSGILRMSLVWQTDSQQRPHAAADITIDPLQVQLHSHHLLLLYRLINFLGRSGTEELSAAPTDDAGVPPASSRSFLADVLLPNTTSFAKEFLYQSWHQDSREGQESEYYDADSLLGSFRSGLSSFVSASAAGMAQGASYFSGLEPEGNSEPESVDGTATHPPIGTDIAEMDVQLNTRDLSVVLWYSEDEPPTGASSDSGSFCAPEVGDALEYRSRLSLEVGQAILKSQSNQDGTTVGLKVYRVEAVEHLPSQTRQSSHDAAVLADSVRIPESLPPLASGNRQVPGLAGMAISPMRRSVYASMLSHMSATASAVQSQYSPAGQVQIWPVLCITGGASADSHSPSMSMTCRKSQGPRQQDCGLKVDVKVRNSVAWLNIDFAGRLHAFMEPLILRLASEPSGRDESRVLKQPESAATSALGNIMAELKELDGQTKGRQSGRKAGLEMTASISNLTSIMQVTTGGSKSRTALAIDVSGQVGGQPTLTLGSSRATAPPSNAAGCASAHLEGTLALTGLKAYLVTSEEPLLQSSHLDQPGSNPELHAACILSLVSVTDSAANHQRRMARVLTLDFRWQQQPAVGDGNAQLAWSHVQKCSQRVAEAKRAEARQDLDEVEAGDAAIKAAVLFVQITAPCACLQISQVQLAELWAVVSPLLHFHEEIQASMARALGIQLPITDASPTVIKVKCGLKCNLLPFSQGCDIDMEDRVGCLFRVDADCLDVMAAPGLDGRAASSYLTAFCSGLSLCGQNGVQPLVYCSQKASAGVRYRSVHRQLGAGSLRSEGLASVNLRGLTVGTEEGDLQFAWYQPLLDFFVLPAGEDESPQDSKELVPKSWSVSVENCAVRDTGRSLEEGQDTLSAALMIGTLDWATPSGDVQVIEMGHLTLLASEISGERARAAGGPIDLPNSSLLSEGYACLAQEGGLTITIEPSQEASVADPGEEVAGFQHIQIRNQRLKFPLTKTSLERLSALVGRLSSAFGGSGAASVPQDLEPPDTELLAEPLRQLSGILDVLDENAFTDKRQGDKEEEEVLVPCIVEEDCFIPIPIPSSLEAGGVEEQGDEAELPGGAPVIIEDFFKDRFWKASASRLPGAATGDDLGVNFWYQGSGSEAAKPLVMQEEYIKPPPPNYVPPSSQKCALRPLPEGYPQPALRVSLAHLTIVAALCHTDADQGNEDIPATCSRVELDLDDLCLQADVFEPGSHYARRITLSIGNIALRDCSLRPEAAPAWKQIFGQNVSATSPRGTAACMLTVELESVCPDSGNEELRLKVSVLPLRLRLDQDVVTFLQAFFSMEHLSPEAEPLLADSLQPQPSSGVFFQRCEIRAIPIIVDYKPRRLDVAALRGGNLVEVLNITAWSDVRVHLPAVTLTGVQGWDELSALLAQRYINHITSSQVQNFIAGIKPIQSILRIGSAAGQLLAIPADALRGKPEVYSQAKTAAANKSVSRQLQRGIFGLVRAIIAEGLGISAGALGGLHLVLAGPSAAISSARQAQPSNMTEGMRQAADRLASGVGNMGTAFSSRAPSEAGYRGGSGYGSAAVRALRAAPGAIAKPLSEGAAAARCALLGAKNSLDPEQYEKKYRR